MRVTNTLYTKPAAHHQLNARPWSVLTYQTWVMLAKPPAVSIETRSDLQVTAKITNSPQKTKPVPRLHQGAFKVIYNQTEFEHDWPKDGKNRQINSITNTLPKKNNNNKMQQAAQKNTNINKFQLHRMCSGYIMLPTLRHTWLIHHYQDLQLLNPTMPPVYPYCL